jgi:cytochrome c-type biogenesis protein CcmH/NrfG
VYTNFDAIQALTREHRRLREEEAASERLVRGLHARLAHSRELERRRTVNAQRASRRRALRLATIALAGAIGSGATAGAYQAFGANGTHSRAPIVKRIAPAKSRIASNLNPTGSCSGLALPGKPVPC